MVCELTVAIKGDESSFKKKFLVYDDFVMNEEDSTIKRCIREALDDAKIEDPEIKIRALLVV